MFNKMQWKNLNKQTDPILALAIMINGIQTSKEESFHYGQLKFDALNKSCPVIAFHNQPGSFAQDYRRIALEAQNVETTSIVGVRQLLITSMDYLAKVCPNFRIVVGAHSEGSLILYKALQWMDEVHKKMAMEHLIIRTYGAVQFIPDNYGINTWNVLSDKDKIASFSRRFQTGSTEEGCNVRYVPCITPRSEWTALWGDHAFLGKTYQKAFEEDMGDIRGKNVPVYKWRR